MAFTSFRLGKNVGIGKYHVGNIKTVLQFLNCLLRAIILFLIFQCDKFMPRKFQLLQCSRFKSFEEEELFLTRMYSEGWEFVFRSPFSNIFYFKKI